MKYPKGTLLLEKLAGTMVLTGGARKTEEHWAVIRVTHGMFATIEHAGTIYGAMFDTVVSDRMCEYTVISEWEFVALKLAH